MIPIKRFDTPDIANTIWPCDLDEGALRDADRGKGARPGVAPIPEGTPSLPAIPHDGQVPSRAEALHSLAGLIAGACVHASDKKAGALMDVIFAPQGWRLRYLVAATGGTGLPWHQRVVEAERVEGIGFAASTIALGLSRKELHRTLDLHELDDLDSKWYSKLLACYGIGTTT